MTVKSVYEIVGKDSTTRAFRSVDKGVEKLSRAFNALGLAAAAGGAALAALGKDSLDFADKVGHVSTRLGVSVEALSQYRHVAELSGVTFDQLTGSWQRQARRIAEATKGTGEAVKALKELNLSAEALHQLSPEKQFEALADALGQVSNQSDRVRLMFKVWDSDGVRLGQIANLGAEGIRNLREESDRLGATLSSADVLGAQKFAGAMTKLTTALRGVGNVIMREFGPTLEALGNFIGEEIPKAVETVSHAFSVLRVVMVDVLLNLLETQDKVLRSFANMGSQIQAAIETLADVFPRTIGVVATKLLEMQKRLGEHLDNNAAKLAKTKRALLETRDAMELYTRGVKEFTADIKEVPPAVEEAAGEIDEKLTPATTRYNQVAVATAGLYRRQTKELSEYAKRVHAAAAAQRTLTSAHEAYWTIRQQFELHRFGGNEATEPFQVGGPGTSFVQLGRYRTRYENGVYVGQEELRGAGHWRPIPGRTAPVAIGSRATGGEIAQGGAYMLEAGERVVSANTTIGPINLTVNGSNMSGGDLRTFVRQSLIPELRAATR